MPRRARVVLAGVPHHVTQRGSRRMRTFFDDDDFALYRSILGDCCRAAGVEVWAYCQMPNHVHLLLVPPTPEALSDALRPAHSAYAREVNGRKGWTGHLWQARFFSVPIPDRRLIGAVRYVLQNPVRARLVRDAADWRHASTRDLLDLERDPLVTRTSLASYVSDWGELLEQRMPTGPVAELRRASRTGRWLDAEDRRYFPVAAGPVSPAA